MSFPKSFYRWRPHPWHGLEVGPNPPEVVHAYIEITPFDTIKYEIDKVTGYMWVDRPQHTSSQPPALYGFIPRTYCSQRVKKLSPKSDRGDGDPLDIFVISERPFDRAEVILSARVIGCVQATDSGEADDKIIAILQNDRFWESVEDISDLPDVLLDRMLHYLETYKMVSSGESKMAVQDVLDRERAFDVVRAAMADYQEAYGEEGKDGA
jgi:inorganic pyrophosphatase